MMPTEHVKAVALARKVTGAAPDLPVEVTSVCRLDRAGDYFLVTIGCLGEPGWVVAVDDDGTEVMSWAENPSGEPMVPPNPGSGRYVWTPSSRSRSPLYPLLEIDSPDGKQYFDLRGPVTDFGSADRG